MAKWEEELVALTLRAPLAGKDLITAFHKCFLNHELISALEALCWLFSLSKTLIFQV